MEDSSPNRTLATSTSSTVSIPAPGTEKADEPKKETETVSWDRTLTWENSLNKLKLLKSIGNGIKRHLK